ncbi:MAG: response regulator [Methanomassiliicoccaceae archaeon]|nr:response regulator [Methanomassiliicoccaceae archaeon]
MRVLIVDDNAALQEILTEVVTDAGHSAEVASTIDRALSLIASFRPDVILLDTDMHEGRGLILLDRMQDNSPSVGTPVIIIRSWNRQIPRDSPVATGRIEKPFTAQDVLESIEKVRAEGTDTGEAPVVPAAKQSETDQEPPGETLAQKGVSYGSSYVMFRSSSNEIHDLISAFGSEGCDVLVVTTRKKKTVMKRFRNSNINVLTMTIRLLGGHFDIYGLGTMIDNVEEFIRGAGRPVVAFDDLNKIMDRNGVNSTLTAIHQLVTKKYDKDHTFLVSLDPKKFTKKDKEILLNHMVNHDPIGE